MLQNIKSSYFIKLIYTFIEESKKLKLIRYNKSMQNNLDISTINYKYFSGRYIIYESNGIGKEYNGEDDTLLFEGEYLNWEKNGQGKKYLDDTLLFEGECLNGKRNGKGKEYDYEGKLEFEGKYLNDKEWIETRYDDDGNILYTFNNNINGEGKEYYESGKLKFEDEYLNGGKNGKGKEYYNNGKLIFKGEYKNDL